MIEYKLRFPNILQYKGLHQKVDVLLDYKKVGVIKFVEVGWQYFAKGEKQGGEIFSTISLVKKSLQPD